MLTPEREAQTFADLARAVPPEQREALQDVYDEIDRLRAEVERLTEERDEWKERCILTHAEDRERAERAEAEVVRLLEGRDIEAWTKKIDAAEAEVERLRAQRNEAIEIYDTALFDIAALKADAERLAGAGDKLRRIVSGGWVPSERDRQAKIAGWDEALRQHEGQKEA